MMQIRAIEREKMAKVRADNAAYQNQIRQAERAARAEAAAQTRARRDFRRTAFGGMRGAANTLGSVGKAGIAAVGVGGGAMAASAISQAARLDEMSRRIVIASRAPGEETKFKSEDVRKQIVNTAIKRGLDPEKLAEGMQLAMDKTGDLSAALANLDTVAAVTQATGGDATDAYMLQADAMQKFGLNAEQSSQAMAVLIAQGKKGAFTFKNMANLAPKAFAAAASFGFKGEEGLAQIGGMMQVARNVTGSDEQAAFATEAMLRQMTAKGKDMQSGKAFGGRKVNVFKDNDPRKGANNFRDILGGVLTASEGNLAQLQEVFGEEGIRSMRPFMGTFRETREAAMAKGVKREDANVMARDAALKVLDDATNVKTSFKDVEKDAADAMKSFTVQLEIFNTKMKEAIASEVFPELVKLAPELTKLVPHIREAAKGFVDLVKFFASNPWTGLAGIIGLAFAKEIAAAKIASIIQNGFGGGKGMPGGAPGPMGGGGGAMIAGTLALAGTALAVDQAGKLQSELGTKGSLTDFLPGFEKGKFSGDTALSDMAGLATFGMLGTNPITRGAGALGETMTAAHDLGKPVEQRIGLQKSAPMAFRSAQQQMPVKVEGGPEMLAAAKQWSALPGEIRSALANSGPNRTNSPSPVK
jgi:TP901 family phage tail tape measure protein